MTGTAGRAVDVEALAGLEITGCAVLLHTGGDVHWGTPAYAQDAPYLTEAGAAISPIVAPPWSESTR